VTHKPNFRPSLLLASILLSAGVPYLTTYPKIEVAGANYLHSGCQSELGPHSIPVTLQIRQRVLLRVRVECEVAVLHVPRQNAAPLEVLS
jgi:hypothetical protein